jgi:DNA-binding SARP family transcriptional activator/TolB-like protein
MFRLLTFGGLSLTDDGAPVTGAASQRSRLALLAVLAAAGPTGISRDKLLACLWPESDDERARHALKQAVYSLRRDLGNETAITGTATLSLDANVVTSDVREFDDAIAIGNDTAAVALYAGPFLDGVFVRASPEFDQWAAAERSRLERSHIDAIGRLARAADAAGDQLSSVQWWRRAAAAEPLSGRVALSLMRALAESGDVSAALQHARVHEALVRGELDSPADDAVLSFSEELRGGTWSPPRRTPVPTPQVEVARAEEPVVVTFPAARKSGRSRIIAAVVFALVLVVGVTIAIMSRSAGRKTTSPKRIVVARFDNKTGDKTLDPFGDLVADFLAQTLLESNFEVDSRTSALAARMIEKLAPAGTALDRAAALAKSSGAATVIAGRYYRQGDTLLVQADIIDPARGVILQGIGPLRGSRSSMSSLVSGIANRVTAAMMASTDSTAGGSTASLAAPPSVEAYEHASRGWEMFFERPSDTAAAFAELARASALDSSYNAPLLMRAYILDVKGQWPALARIVAMLNQRRATMGRAERETMALFEADLRGDLLGRLRASRAMVQLSPGSPDMALLVALSASYLNRFAEADASLAATSPERGINRVSPMYWAWRSLAQHRLGRFDEELASAGAAAESFPASPEIYVTTYLRAFAARGATTSIDSVLAKAGFDGANPDDRAISLAMLAARELRAHDHEADAMRIATRLGQIAALPRRARENSALQAELLYEAGEITKARTVYASLGAAKPNDLDVVGRLGTIAARTGDSLAMRAIEKRLADWRGPYAFGEATLWRARIEALSGRSAEAVTLLHAAIAQGYRPTELGVITLHDDMDFTPLWKDQAFRELVRPREGGTVLP